MNIESIISEAAQRHAERRLPSPSTVTLPGGLHCRLNWQNLNAASDMIFGAYIHANPADMAHALREMMIECLVSAKLHGVVIE